MKKTLALLIALALMVSTAAIPALAEEAAGETDTVTSATTQKNQNSRGGRGNNPRQMPGQNGQTPGQSTVPGQNSQGGQNGQMPVNPGKGGRNSRQANGQSGLNGQTVKQGKTVIFDRLLADGVITQEVYDAIVAWFQAQVPQTQQNAAAPAEGTEPPALPDGTAPAEGTESPVQDSAPAEAQEQLLKTLLDSGAITQEQYDLLISGLQAAPEPPAAPSGI